MRRWRPTAACRQGAGDVLAVEGGSRRPAASTERAGSSCAHTSAPMATTGVSTTSKDHSSDAGETTRARTQSRRREGTPACPAARPVPLPVFVPDGRLGMRGATLASCRDAGRADSLKAMACAGPGAMACSGCRELRGSLMTEFPRSGRDAGASRKRRTWPATTTESSNRGTWPPSSTSCSSSWRSRSEARRQMSTVPTGSAVPYTWSVGWWARPSSARSFRWYGPGRSARQVCPSSFRAQRHRGAGEGVRDDEHRATARQATSTTTRRTPTCGRRAPTAASDRGEGSLERPPHWPSWASRR